MERHPGQSEPTEFPSVFPAETTDRTVDATVPARQTVWWIMVVLLAVIATALMMRLDEGWSMSSALAQEATGLTNRTGALGRGRLGAAGIHAFSGQLDRSTFGIFMVDVDAATIWCYALERNNYDGQFKMKLVAARSWWNDSQLEEYNVLDPTPGAVGEMLKQMAAQRGSGPAGQEDGSLKLPITTGLDKNDAAK